MADLTVRVNARTGDAERGLGRVTRHLAVMRAIAGRGAGIGLATAGIASLGTIALASASQLAGLIIALSQVALAVLPLPGILAGAGIGLLGLGLALKDAKTQLAGLGPEFAKVQKAASAQFWAAAAAPIKALATSVLPTLRTGLGAVGSAWGQFAAVTAAALQRLTAGPGFGQLFTTVAASIRVASGAMGPLLTALAQIGAVGTPYIIPLAQAFVALSQRFAAFIAQASASGQLTAWAAQGLAALSQLGGVIGQVLTLVGTLLGSMSRFGGGMTSLNPLLMGLTQINAALAGPIGQNLMAQVFGAAQTAMAGLGPAFAALGTVLAALVPVLATTLPVAAQLISTVFAALAPVVTQLAAALTPLIPIIGQALTAAVQAVAPILAQLATAVFPVLAQVIAALLPIAAQLVQALAAGLMPIVSALMPVLAALTPVFGQIAAVVGMLVAAVAPLIAQLAQSLAPIITQVGLLIADLAGTILSAVIPVLAQILPPLTAVASALIGVLGGAITALMPIVKGVFENIKIIITGVLGIVSGLIKTVSAVMRGDWSGAMDGIRQISSSAMTMVQSLISNGIQTVTSYFRGLPGALRSALSGLPSDMREVGTNIINAMSGGIQSMASSVAARARETVLGAVRAAKQALGIASPSRVFLQIGRYSGEGLAQGLTAMSGRVSAAGTALASAAVPDAPAFAAGRSGGSVGDVTVNVTGFVGSQSELARTIRAALSDEARESGRLATGGVLL